MNLKSDNISSPEKLSGLQQLNLFALSLIWKSIKKFSKIRRSDLEAGFILLSF